MSVLNCGQEFAPVPFRLVGIGEREVSNRGVERCATSDIPCNDDGIASPRIDRLYDIARANGALGGKISGAGGGGFFLFYAEEGKKELRRAMQAEGLRVMRFRVDFEGSKILMDLLSGEQYRDHDARLRADAGTSC